RPRARKWPEIQLELPYPDCASIGSAEDVPAADSPSVIRVREANRDGRKPVVVRLPGGAAVSGAENISSGANRGSGIGVRKGDAREPGSRLAVLGRPRQATIGRAEDSSELTNSNGRHRQSPRVERLFLRQWVLRMPTRLRGCLQGPAASGDE